VIEINSHARVSVQPASLSPSAVAQMMKRPSILLVEPYPTLVVSGSPEIAGQAPN
jgi:hypothetical protein